MEHPENGARLLTVDGSLMRIITSISIYPQIQPVEVGKVSTSQVALKLEIH